MATVIDELVVILGLDSAKFSADQKKVAEEFLKLKENARRSATEAKGHTDKLTDAFTTLQGKLLGITALFLGGMGITQFGEHVAKLTNQLGRLSQQAGVSAADLSAWGNAGRVLGANPGAVQAGVQGLAAAGNQIEPNAQLYQTLAAMGIQPRRLANGDFDVNGTLMAMSQWAAQRKAQGWGTGRITGALMHAPGMNSDLASVIEQGPDRLRASLSQMKGLGPTPNQVAAIDRLVKAWGEMEATSEKLGTTLLVGVEPVLEKILTVAQKFFGFVNSDLTHPTVSPAASGNLPVPGMEGIPGSIAPSGATSGFGKLGDRIGRWWRGEPEPALTMPSGSVHASTLPSGGVTSSGGSIEGATAAGVIDRSRFKAELAANPMLAAKVMAIAAGENNNPQANMSVMESMMNRAAMTGTSLAYQARTTGEGGYYAGFNPSALRDPRRRAILERHLQTVLGGSNVSNYATDNSSGSLAAREMGSGSFQFQSTAGGEYFFSPGSRNAGHGRDRAHYDAWLRNVRQGTAARNANVMGNSTISTSATHSSHVDIGEMNIHTAATGPYDIAAGIHSALTNVKNVAPSDTGPW